MGFVFEPISVLGGMFGFSRTLRPSQNRVPNKSWCRLFVFLFFLDPKDLKRHPKDSTTAPKDLQKTEKITAGSELVPAIIFFSENKQIGPKRDFKRERESERERERERERRRYGVMYSERREEERRCEKILE